MRIESNVVALAIATLNVTLVQLHGLQLPTPSARHCNIRPWLLWGKS